MSEASSQPIRVMLVDDHTMVRLGLTTLLKVHEDLELAGEASTGEAAVRLSSELLPDVILMDLKLPDMDGATATHVIREQLPQVEVIALTSYNEPELIKSALEAGAIGYLLKDVSAEELAHAIRAAHSGRATLSAEATRVMIRASSQPPKVGFDLTDREHEVLALLVEGLTNDQIAAKLNVEPSTIKSHVSNILSKLGVTSRTEAASLALRQGLIT